MVGRKMMNVKKTMRLGRMPSSLEYVKRFSMCNCLTIPMPDTYTAHGMTVSYFVQRVIPGRKADVFKIPRKIDTFLFSPFNEAFHKARDIEDIRYTRAWRGPADIKDFGKRPLSWWTLARFRKEILRLDKRMSEIWGGALKILVLYDSSRAKQSIWDRLSGYDEVAVETLDWPLVQVKCDLPESRRGPWHHYPVSVVGEVLDAIETIEEDRCGSS